ncbi:MAG: ATP phosphoribosyltransferase regulatory subunit [Lachnospiraceae bacterium]|nr:ATP phosphoribosyltransferase regulatory subunit [Lachnospiraceae bacterium]
MINDASVDADAEMIAMVIECLKQAGLSAFQVEIGHADFFNGLLEEVDLSDQEVDLLKTYLEQKNMSGLEILLRDKVMDPEVKNLLIDLPMLFGNVENLSAAVARTHNKRALDAVARLAHLYEVLDSYGFQQYLTFDLGLLSQHDYYTGIIFKAYTYGTGDPIALGGRYDHLIAKFGKEAPSIGFAILVDSLLNALHSQEETISVEERTLLLYPATYRREAIAYGHALRSEGRLVSLIRKSSRREMEEYLAYAKKQGFSQILWMENPDEVHTLPVKEADL